MCQGDGDATASHEEVAPLLGRRGFLRTAAAGVVAAGATGWLGADAVAADAAVATDARSGGSGDHRVPPGRISIQLYTLRNQLAIDLEGTLAALAEIGYRRVETAGFVGRTVTEFKAALDAVGIWASSNHIGIPQPFDAAAWSASLADARVLESRYVVHPAFGINFGTGVVVRDRATWAAFAHDLNEAGRMAREAGLRLGYHNHNWEFFRLADDPSHTAYDVLIEETDPRYVHFEMDLFWVFRGARDPVDLLRRLRGRVRQFHVKDLNQAGSFEDPGQGLIDFPRIFRTQQVDEYIVERDDAGSPPRTPADALVTARVGYQFLRTVRY
jgi:sugar phosphate isomerase/epimerase